MVPTSLYIHSWCSRFQKPEAEKPKAEELENVLVVVVFLMAAGVAFHMSVERTRLAVHHTRSLT